MQRSSESGRCCLKVASLNEERVDRSGTEAGENAVTCQLKLTDSPAGVVVPVKLTPGAKNSGVKGVHDGRLKLAVTAVAEKGKANVSARKLLTRLLGVATSNVQVLSGEISREKRFIVTGLSLETVESKLRSLMLTDKSQ